MLIILLELICKEFLAKIYRQDRFRADNFHPNSLAKIKTYIYYATGCVKLFQIEDNYFTYFDNTFKYTCIIGVY